MGKYCKYKFEAISARFITMKVLIVSSVNSGQVSPFVNEQVESVKSLGVEFEYYNVQGHGISGYLKNFLPLRRKIRSYLPDIIHAHYGLSGLLSLLAKRRVPLVTTFHGNDINSMHPLKTLKPNWNKMLSRVVHFGDHHSIFVTEDIANQINARPFKSDIIPCQVNLDTFYPIVKFEARKYFKLSSLKRYVLFSSSFRTPIKNYPLAKEACLQFENLELIELNGYTRKEVNLLMNACDLALITSYNEGSCQFLKEAMACNRPIVSTKAGDSEWIFGNTDGCYLTMPVKEDVIINIKKALDFSYSKGQTNGRARIIELGLNSETTAGRVFGVYKKVLKNRDQEQGTWN
jgi:teichuronic acid biosynthesis glycosyltransferase TuaC